MDGGHFSLPQVRLDDGTEMALRPANLRPLPPEAEASPTSPRPERLEPLLLGSTSFQPCVEIGVYIVSRRG